MMDISELIGVLKALSMATFGDEIAIFVLKSNQTPCGIAYCKPHDLIIIEQVRLQQSLQSLMTCGWCPMRAYILLASHELRHRTQNLSKREGLGLKYTDRMMLGLPRCEALENEDEEDADIISSLCVIAYDWSKRENNASTASLTLSGLITIGREELLEIIASVS